MSRLLGKIAIVTGAGRGIGHAIALRFGAEGATVVAANRNVTEGEAVVEAIRAGGGKAAFIRTDIRLPEDCEALIAEAEERFGRVDILCNNAGVGLLRTVVETTLDDYVYLMDTNVRGAFLLCKHAIPGMVSRGSGVVVNMASVAGTLGGFGQASYSTTKSGILGLTKTLAMEGGRHGITCNAIVPGIIGTEAFHMASPVMNERIAARTVFKRPGEPQDIANAIAFLCSDLAGYITGVGLYVSGGIELFVF